MFTLSVACFYAFHSLLSFFNVSTRGMEKWCFRFLICKQNHESLDYLNFFFFFFIKMHENNSLKTLELEKKIIMKIFRMKHLVVYLSQVSWKWSWNFRNTGTWHKMCSALHWKVLKKVYILSYITDVNSKCPK